MADLKLATVNLPDEVKWMAIGGSPEVDRFSHYSPFVAPRDAEPMELGQLARKALAAQHGGAEETWTLTRLLDAEEIAQDFPNLANRPGPAGCSG